MSNTSAPRRQSKPIPCDVALGENGDVAVVIEPPRGKMDIAMVEVENGVLRLVAKSGARVNIGPLERQFEDAMAELKDVVLAQVWGDSEDASAEEVPVKVTRTE
ncbi:MAG: hypothetical protein Alpg2KO_19630 [Alphaproteobacteria bacterium]